MVIEGRHLINGAWEAGTDRSATGDEPWTRNTIIKYNQPGKHQIDAAVICAGKAYHGWDEIGLESRIIYLKKFIAALEKRKEELVSIVSLEAGKPKWEAAQEVAVLSGKLDASILAFEKRATQILAPSNNSQVVVKTTFRSHGACLVLGPYNFPLHMMNGQIIPALLTGNTVILKPSEHGCASATCYVDAACEAGLPPGVLQLLLGEADLGRQLVQHEGVNAVFFTGSSLAGNWIRQRCAERNVPCAIEAGGNSVIVVGDYGNTDKAADIIVNSAFWSAGQRCNNARHILVTQAAYERGIVDTLATKATGIRAANDVNDAESFYGVMRRGDDMLRLAEYKSKLSKNAIRIVLDTVAPSSGGATLSPFIVEMPAFFPIEQEEQMGPVLQIRVVKNIQEAIVIANSIDLRLTAGILTKSHQEYADFARQIKFGNIVWNGPTANASGYASFGGRGNSGNSRPAGFLAVDFCVTPVSEFMVPDGTT